MPPYLRQACCFSDSPGALNGVPLSGKLWSTPAQPARCKLCGKLSAEPTASRRILSVVHYIAPIVAVWQALELRAWWPIYAYGVFLVLAGVLTFTLIPLRAVTSETAKREFRQRNVVLLVLLAFAVVSVIAAVLDK